MYKNKRILAIIPARGGSKGVPKKNIIDVLGKPLLAYSIQEAKKSKYLDKLFISTDDVEIQKVAEEYGIEVPFLRPTELALDTSKTIDCLVHAVNTLQESGENYDYIILLQNTSPLRKSWHIDEAIERLLESEERSLVSLHEVSEHPILMRSITEEGIIKNLLNVGSTVRRQEFPKYYKVNGAIYIQKLDENFNLNTSLNDGKLAYIMEPRYSVDIDNYLDIKIVEYYLKKEQEEAANHMI